MKKVIFFAAVCAVAMISCVPLASTTNSFEEEKDDNTSIVDNEVADKSENDSNVVTDESADELIDEEVSDSDELISDDEVADELLTDEENDSEVSDEILVDEEEVSDEDIVIPAKPEINVLKNSGGALAQDSTVSLLFYSSEIAMSDLCLKYQISGASIGVDYGMQAEFVCGPNTVKIVKGTSAAQINITNLNKTADDKEMVITVKEGEGYELGSGSSVVITLLGKEEEVSDTEESVDEEISDDDSLETEEESDIDSVEETEETPDEDSVETEGEESDDSEVSDEILTDEEPDETPDVDIEPPVIATEPGTSTQCHDFQTLLQPGTTVELWSASGSRGPVVTNAMQVPVWYSHTGWCAATSDYPMDAQGEDWSAEDVQCVGHNGDRC